MENQNQPQKEQGLSIKMYDVHSNKLNKIGWYFCPQTLQGVFIAEFPRQIRYMYYPIDKKIYDAMFSSKSKGQYFTEEIQKKPGVTCVKLGQPKLEL